MKRKGGVRLIGLFGSPVGHSLSPAMHNAAFKALGLPWTYLPFEVRPSVFQAALNAVKALGMPGCNLTIPLKELSLRYLDEISEPVRLIGAVNTVENRDGVLRGHNTDGEGYIRSLIEECGIVLQGKNVLIVGAGGAARGIAFSLIRRGVGSISVCNRALDFYRAKRLIRDIKRAFPGAHLACLPLKEGALKRIFPSVDLLIHATPMGTGGKGVVPLPLGELKREAVVSDIVYNPRVTPLLRQALDIGLRVHHGIGMLLHQGAMSLEIWTKRKAPLDIMRKALCKNPLS